MSGTGTLSELITALVTATDVGVTGTTTSTNVVTDNILAQNDLSRNVTRWVDFTSNGTALKIFGYATWRLGDSPPTKVTVIYSYSAATASSFFVSVTEPLRAVTLGSFTETILADTNDVFRTMTLPITGTQFTALSDECYLISVNGNRASGNGTISVWGISLSR